MSSDNTENEQLIKFSAQVSKVTTMADGGLRVVLDMAETEIDVARQFMQAKQAGAILEIVAVPVTEKKEW
ncbi:MAG: hypothetical protein E6Q97_28040 [Desulfurellales bacterium]|nr:MAG: hypothetical protein E6Q97_28040 [Desulfurellales bacterium]